MIDEGHREIEDSEEEEEDGSRNEHENEIFDEIGSGVC